MNNDKITAASEVSGENLLPKTEKKELKLEEIELGKENSQHCNDKIAENNNNTELNQEVSDCKVTIKRILSEGEASSGFETVSSLDSNIGADDFVLSSTADEDDFNVVVQIENELAFQSHKASNERTFYWGVKKNTPDNYSNRTDSFLSDYTNKRYDDSRISNREQKPREYYKYDEYKDNEGKIEKKFSNKETFICTRRYSPQEHNWDRSKEFCSKHLRKSRSGHDSRQRHSRSRPKSSRPRRSRSSSNDSRTRCSRSSDHGSKQRYSRSSDYDSRARGSGSGSSDYDPRSKHSRRISSSRSLRNSERTIRLNSKEKLALEDRKTEGRHSRSFSKNLERSNLERNSTSRKRKRRSFSKSPTSDWKSKKKSRKKERTPFLIELERKLKEADRLKGSKTELVNGSVEKSEVSSDITDKPTAPEGRSKSQNPIAPPDAPVPEMSSNAIQNTVLPLNPPLPEAPFETNQNPAAPPLSMAGIITQNPYPTTFNSSASSIPSVGVPYQYAFPINSVNNLPLVLGPTGVPVHITLTGEQIPHDFEGRPIPVGPNGFYLPLDPTGRLFPHIVSPGNQAVPIHMTEDGVLRLPNSDPVPYGPSHHLPVNIDGRVIPIGRDSKPLYPCPGLPREPPLHLLRMISTEPIPQQEIPKTPQMGNQQTVPTSGEEQKEQISSQESTEALKIESALVHIIQNPFGKINRANLLKNYKKKARERCEDVLKCIEIQKNLGVNPSKGGVKRSTPMKLSQKKTPVQDTDTSGSDMVLDSDDPESTSSVKRKKGSIEEIILSEEEQDNLQAVCDTETPITTNTHPKPKPRDLIVKKVQQAIKSLCERSYKPPVFGRFIISKQTDSVLRKSPNESPLLRNRIILPFVTPGIPNSHSEDESVVEENTEITFKFLSQKVTKIGEKPSDTSKCEKNSSNALKNPVFTFDFSMQCDFTTVVVHKLKKKVAELEAEVVRLRNKNAELLEDYKNVQTMNEDKSDELRKALLQVRKRKTEIQTFRGSFRKRGK